MKQNYLDPNFIDNAWDDMSSVLDEKMGKRKKRRFFYWYIIPIFLLGVLTGWYLFQDADSNNVETYISQSDIEKPINETETDIKLQNQKESVLREEEEEVLASASNQNYEDRSKLQLARVKSAALLEDETDVQSNSPVPTPVRKKSVPKSTHYREAQEEQTDQNAELSYSNQAQQTINDDRQLKSEKINNHTAKQLVSDLAIEDEEKVRGIVNTLHPSLNYNETKKSITATEIPEILEADPLSILVRSQFSEVISDEMEPLEEYILPNITFIAENQFRSGPFVHFSAQPAILSASTSIGVGIGYQIRLLDRFNWSNSIDFRKIKASKQKLLSVSNFAEPIMHVETEDLPEVFQSSTLESSQQSHGLGSISNSLEVISLTSEISYLIRPKLLIHGGFSIDHLLGAHSAFGVTELEDDMLELDYNGFGNNRFLKQYDIYRNWNLSGQAGLEYVISRKFNAGVEYRASLFPWLSSESKSGLLSQYHNNLEFNLRYFL